MILDLINKENKKRTLSKVLLGGVFGVAVAS